MLCGAFIRQESLKGWLVILRRGREQVKEWIVNVSIKWKNIAWKPRVMCDLS